LREDEFFFKIPFLAALSKAFWTLGKKALASSVFFSFIRREKDLRTFWSSCFFARFLTRRLSDCLLAFIADFVIGILGYITQEV